MAHDFQCFSMVIDAHVFFRILKKVKKGSFKNTAKSMMKYSCKT